MRRQLLQRSTAERASEAPQSAPPALASLLLSRRATPRSADRNLEPTKATSMERRDNSKPRADRCRAVRNDRPPQEDPAQIERAAVGGFAESLVGLRGLRLLQVPADP